MPSLEEMASKGERKYSAKVGAMDDHYGAAIPRAKRNYGELPFGPTVKGNYNAAMDSYALDNYRAAIGPECASRWKENWMEKMRA